MYKIAAMGDKDSVLGFKALGLEVCPVESPEAGREALHRMAKENYAIIYMTEQLAAQLPQEIARYKDALTPAIILIPGKEGSLGIGMANVKTAVERAVGADILEDAKKPPSQREVARRSRDGGSLSKEYSLSHRLRR